VLAAGGNLEVGVEMHGIMLFIMAYLRRYLTGA
jgi:hypothetical protein